MRLSWEGYDIDLRSFVKLPAYRLDAIGGKLVFDIWRGVVRGRLFTQSGAHPDSPAWRASVQYFRVMNVFYKYLHPEIRERLEQQAKLVYGIGRDLFFLMMGGKFFLVIESDEGVIKSWRLRGIDNGSG